MLFKEAIEWKHIRMHRILPKSLEPSYEATGIVD